MCSKIAPAGTITSARSGLRSYLLARSSGVMSASSSSSFVRRPSGTAAGFRSVSSFPASFLAEPATRVAIASMLPPVPTSCETR